MTSPPRISIVTPSFQQAAFLERTIRSVLEQGYENLEYVVVDGGSTDGSVDIVRRHADRLAHWESEPDRGQSHALNKGFARTTGEIMGWLNSDDVLEEGALAAVAEAARRRPDAVAFVGHGRLVTEDGREVWHHVPKDLSFDRLARREGDAWIPQPSCFWRRAAWEAVGPLEEELHYAMDLALWLRLAKQGPIAEVDRLLSTALQHARMKTVAHDFEQRAEIGFVCAREGAPEIGHATIMQVARRANALRAEMLYYRNAHRLLRRSPLGRVAHHFAKRRYGPKPPPALVADEM